jgi:peptide/nickel transport system substrate-binding protein
LVRYIQTLAEWSVAGKRRRMRRLLPVLLLSLAALAAPGCRQQPEGAPRVVVIGGKPEIRDPAEGPLAASDAVLLENVAQGLVRFDASGNIVGGLAERWNVSDDGLSYIFRIASMNWPDGRKISAQQVAKLLKRTIAQRSDNPLKDSLGAVEDIVAMTDRVIEIRLVAPRPNLLALLAQPEMAILRGKLGTGPFSAAADEKSPGTLRLTRNVLSPDEESATKEEVLLSGAPVAEAVRAFANGEADLVLGGTFDDLPFAHRTKLPRGSLQFDPASGLFGLIPLHAANGLDDPDLRRMLAQAIDRDTFVAALGVPNLAARATLLEPGLDGMGVPVAPSWAATPLADRIAALRAEADGKFGAGPRPTFHVLLPEGPGAELVLRLLARSWGALGISVERAENERDADFALVDQVAPSASAGWFVRRFRCGAAAICDPEIDKLIDAARQTPVPQQRAALLQQTATRVDDGQLFLPITAPVRWSLVSGRIQGFAGNRFAIHTLTDLEQKPGTGN